MSKIKFRVRVKQGTGREPRMFFIGLYDRFLESIWKVMQFTDLNDKDGKKDKGIYEGDIVKLPTASEKYEVLGNIYENPELLTK